MELGVRTDALAVADPPAASSFSNPIASAAWTICKHSSGVNTSMTINAPGNPGTSTRDDGLGRFVDNRIAPGVEPWTVES